MRTNRPYLTPHSWGRPRQGAGPLRSPGRSSAPTSRYSPTAASSPGSAATSPATTETPPCAHLGSGHRAADGHQRRHAQRLLQRPHVSCPTDACSSPAATSPTTVASSSQAYNYATGLWEAAVGMRAGPLVPHGQSSRPTARSWRRGVRRRMPPANPLPGGVGRHQLAELLRGAPLTMPYYPWMHAAPTAACSTPAPTRSPATSTHRVAASGRSGPRATAATANRAGRSCTRPGKILIVGGGDPPTNTAETIDLNTGGQLAVHRLDAVSRGGR